jgi:hypothetical protein
VTLTGFYLQNGRRLWKGAGAQTGGKSRLSNRPAIQPLFIFPPAAILRGGALSGTFHPNGVGRKDMIITADIFLRGRAARRSLRWSPRQIANSRDALSVGPLRWPEPEAGLESAHESAFEYVPAQLAATRAYLFHLLVFPLVSTN